MNFPENATILPGENSTFICNSKILTTIWRIGSDTGSRDLDTERLIGNQNAVDTLAEDSIFLSEIRTGDDYNSTLIITGSKSKNFTRIQCALAQAISIDLNFTSPAFLRVLGKQMVVSMMKSVFEMVPFSPSNLNNQPSGLTTGKNYLPLLVSFLLSVLCPSHISCNGGGRRDWRYFALQQYSLHFIHVPTSGWILLDPPI